MEQISLTRRIDAPPDAVRTEMADVERFMRAAGFDAVERDGDTVTIQNRVGLFEIELVVDLVDRDADLAYEQREGIFESMWTEYHVDPVADGTEVTATTEYEALDLAVVGSIVDGSVVGRQRRTELATQFDWLADRVE